MGRHPTRLRVAVALAAACVLGAGALEVASAGSASMGGPADAPTAPAERLSEPSTIVIGDSALASLRWVPRASEAVLGFEHVLDLESCRRLADISCRGREGRTPPNVVDVLNFNAGRFETAVIAVGYNDSSFGFAEAFDKVVTAARAGGVRRIVWWTLRSDVDYVSPSAVSDHRTFAENNGTLRALIASGRYPDVVLADWGAYSSTKTAWFTTDGVHHRATGAWGAADYLSRKMAFLNDRSCPVPVAPEASNPPKCPDPDVTGPLTNLEALYPIGQDGLLCYEIGESRRFECRRDYHVLQLTRELALYMHGDDAEALKIRLARLGFYFEKNGFIAPNGVAIYPDPDQEFGAATWYAVVRFQESVALPPTGCADKQTLQALGFVTDGLSTATEYCTYGIGPGAGPPVPTVPPTTMPPPTAG